MEKSRTERVIFQPATYEGMEKGIDQIVNVVRPTLGPLPRVVALDRIVSDKMPEILDDGGVITRRIIQIAGRDEDMGAMFVRQLLWRLYEKTGDGTATAAVLFQAVFKEGIRYITAGGNAMVLRRHLEEGLRVILDELSTMATPVEGKEKLAQIAESICYDPPLAKLLGEIFDIIGEYGRLEVRSGRSRELEREYVEGMYWDKSGVVSRQMISDHKELRTQMEDAAVLISNLEIEDPRQLMIVLAKALETRVKKLMIVANNLSDNAIAVLMQASKDPEKFQAIAVKAPGINIHDQTAALEDLAVLTGGQALVRAAGQTLESLTPQHLGRARKAWADRYNFGIVGGKGDPRTLRRHIATLRTAFGKIDDTEDRKRLQERIGKLMGGSATLWVGAATEVQIDARKELAKRTAEAVRGAIRAGVVLGGGTSLLACRPVLQAIADQSDDPDKRAAYRILIKAMEAPTRTIISNAGYDASEVMAQVKLAGPNHGFDVRTGQVVDMTQTGIFDAVNTLQAAVHGAVSSAALALTIDVLIHRKEPPQSTQP
jgi:chaperonin GroEL